MFKKNLLSLSLIFFLSCAGTSKLSLYDVLEQEKCSVDDFRGHGIANEEMAAIDLAKAEIAFAIHGAISVQSESVNEVIDEKDTLYWKRQINRNVYLKNANDAKIVFKKRQGQETGVVACMSRADAAKGFMEQQRLIADSLELVSHSLLATEHPKQKNETWRRIQMLWNGFSRNEKLLNEWNAASPKYLLDSLNETYSKARDDYKNYCQKTKLHWNAEHENLYSNIAFSRLSQNLKMEKSVCKENGISLVYKHTEPDCSYKFGIYNCVYKPSLSVGSCEGIKYFLLENFAERTHQKQEFSLEKLQDSLKTIDFWKKWEQEIKEWSPQCE